MRDVAVGYWVMASWVHSFDKTHTPRLTNLASQVPASVK